MNNNITRRDFLKATGALAVSATVAGCSSLTALQRARSIGANDRIRLAQIGCGGRGIGAHMGGIHKHDKAENVEFIAVSDPWRVAREKAAATAKEWYGTDVKQFSGYRDVLTLKDVDAVMIASPDHHHSAHLEAAAKAGKHAYVEKPLARNMQELHRACAAVEAAGIVVQNGTQIRSLPTSTGANALWKSGLLGKASRIEQCRNSERPYWYSRVKEMKKDDIDWKEFIGDAPKRPFSAELYSGWYGYLDYTDGPAANLGCHFIDLMHYVTGAKYPTNCVCNGGVYTWIDEHKFTCPDHVEALWEYPEGFMVAYSTNFGNSGGNRHRYFCEKGQLIMDNWSSPTYSAEGGPKRDGGIRGVNDVKPIETPDHFLDWLQALRTGKPTRAPLEAGFQHSVAVIMAATSYATGRKTFYDQQRRQIYTA
ncbi:MAG: twin-arginine translocation signal domain-containing protein [Verrucomicrobia bacterium]|nr:twin-arginine translocation signal domain-containing protein [Verrucomicrobiota bacterium]